MGFCARRRVPMHPVTAELPSAHNIFVLEYGSRDPALLQCSHRIQGGSEKLLSVWYPWSLNASISYDPTPSYGVQYVQSWDICSVNAQNECVLREPADQVLFPKLLEATGLVVNMPSMRGCTCMYFGDDIQLRTQARKVVPASAAVHQQHGTRS